MALLPPEYINTVVSIGAQQADKFDPKATGFFIGLLTGSKDESGRNLYRIFLVTNRHVLSDKKEIFLRCNLEAGGHKIFSLALENKEGVLWSSHADPNIDVAIVPVQWQRLKQEEKLKCAFIPEDEFAHIGKIKSEGILQGDGVFVLGFPMGIAGEEQNYVIVRGGIISRLDDEIIRKERAFLIDSTIFPGNSGGPVILKPELSQVGVTKAVSKAYLLGMVKGYVQYCDVARSDQTKQTRVVFMENSGLGYVIPVDYIKEAAASFTVKPKLVAEPKVDSNLA